MSQVYPNKSSCNYKFLSYSYCYLAHIGFNVIFFFFFLSQKKFVEKHRKLMTDFMADREKEEEETNKKHSEELEQLRESLNREFEAKINAYEVCGTFLHMLML